MNRELPSVPIITLAGISSPTDLLTELPLPGPAQSSYNKSLLFHPRVAEEARRLLSIRDTNLAPQLVHALSVTTTDHIELKDGFADEVIRGDIPELLKAILAQNPQVFNTVTPHFAELLPGHRLNSNATTQYPQQVVNPAAWLSSVPHVTSPSSLNVQQRPNQLPAAEQRSSHNIPANCLAAASAEKAVTSSSTTSKVRTLHKEKHKDTVATLQNPGAVANVTQYKDHPRNILESAEPTTKKVPTLKEPKVAILALSQNDIEKHSRQAPAANHVAIQDAEKNVRHTLSATDLHDVRANTKNLSVKLTKLDSALIKHESAKRNSIDESTSSARSKVNSIHEKRATTHKRLSSSSSCEEIAKVSEIKKLRPNHIESTNEVEFAEGSVTVPSHSHKKKRSGKTSSSKFQTDDLLDIPTFRRFVNAMEGILESAENMEIFKIDADDDDAELPPDSLVPRHVMAELCSEAAKLKSMGITKQIPLEKLLKLMSVLLWNIKDGRKLLPLLHQEEGTDQEQLLWRELTMDRVMRSIEAALTALHIMTSVEMPKQVYLEDIIEQVALLTKYQLSNSIYPEFDPVYRTDGDDSGTGSAKAKRSRVGIVKHKTALQMYNKLCDVINTTTELVGIQELTDTVVLQMSALGVAPFFVENIQELQLAAIKLITSIFAKYEKHRQLILEDIFSSLARLPTSKRSLRSFRIADEESIQMVTALALQLIQCVVKLPEEAKNSVDATDKVSTDNEVVIVTSYETAMRTGHQFLTVFLKRCSTKGDEDYRPLFENFIQDLLVTVNKPEWPAAELLLSLLGRLLMQQFSSKTTDVSLRVASLDYLGIIATRLRKDSITSQLGNSDINELLGHVSSEEDGVDGDSGGDAITCKDGDDCANDGLAKPGQESSDKVQSMQRFLLRYLRANSQKDQMLVYAHQFYIAQWYRDAMVYAEKSAKMADESLDISQVDRTTEILQNAEKRKHFLIDEMTLTSKPIPSYGHGKVDTYQATLVARYLASQRPFAQSFDVYLTQILKVLSETAVAVRTKAMKCLTMVVEADPAILARADMEKGVHGRFLDQSTSVREAAVELIGKFILIRPELTEQYYDMLAERILDTGISVRKRVIKIFKDVCQEQPEFSKIPEMCVRMIRRVNDEEGIKKLVTEVFQTMWFTPLSVREKDTHRLLQRVVNITEVVAACKDSSYEFIEQLLQSLLKKEETSGQKPVETACKQIIDCLVENVLKLEHKTVAMTEGKQVSSPRFVACLSTMYLLAKVRPELMVDHAEVLQPYLEIQCSAQGDYLVLQNVAKILELVVPRLSHPSDTFLAQLEEDMMKLILKHGMTVLQSCVSCLAAIVNGVTHNYKLVKDCFQKFFGFLMKTCSDHKANSKAPSLASSKPTLLRSLFTVGILCKHFDFDSSDMSDSKLSVKDRALDLLLYFMVHDDEDVQLKSLNALGFYCTHYYEAMLGVQVKDLYHKLLTNKDVSVVLKCQVLRNLQNYLIQEEDTMSRADSEWQKLARAEDLKEMGDVQSGMASTIMQLYLKQVLEAYFSSQSQVRTSSASVIHLILKQGLVHPVQCIPYLISMNTDCESTVRNNADQLLQDIDKKFPGFVHMKAMAGMKMSYRLQRLIQQDLYEPVRGIRNDENPQALNQSLYSIIRTNRQHRRALVTSLLNLFDDTSKTLLGESVYMADNIAFFPYQLSDEPFFIVHQIDIIVSVSGSNLLQSFREALVHKTECKIENADLQHGLEDDDDDVLSIFSRLPADVLPLQECMLAAQGCILLLALKQHLKDTYSITEGKARKYSPAEAAKVWDKPINRRVGCKFHPAAALELLRDGTPPDNLDDDGRTKLVKDYLQFRQLMMNVDPADDNEDKLDRPSTPFSPACAGEGQNGQEPTGLGVSEIADSGVPVPTQTATTPTVSTLKTKGAHSEKKSHRRSKSASKTPSKKSHKKKKRPRSDEEENSSGDDPDYLA